MARINLLTGFVQPSVLSGSVVVIASATILVLGNISFFLNSGLFYETLLGSGATQDFVVSSQDALSFFTDAVFGNPLLTTLLFFAFWMMVGLFAYISVVSVGSVMREAQSDITRAHYMQTQAKRIRQQALQRFAARFGGLLGFFIWFWILARFLIPFSVLAVRVGINQITTLSGIGYALLGVIVLPLSLHLLVLLGRFIMLKPRVFSNYIG